MEDSSVQLDDVPDEILMIILKNLHNFEVLYSLIGVNKRLDTIVQDSIFTRYLSLILCDNDLKQFANTIFDRFCDEILPKIHDKIESLDVESSFMNRILLSTNYPNLRALALYGLSLETARSLFTDGSYFIDIFKNQLSSLVIHIRKCQEPRSSIEDINIFLYTQIFTRFKNLQSLNFDPLHNSDYHLLTFDESSSNIFSSTLLELRVVVDSYVDCLYLLDGRFNQLHTFDVTICSSDLPMGSVTNIGKKLPNLKRFKLILKPVLLRYYTFLIPLVHRMSNLEELSLYFVHYHTTSVIDGNILEMDIINYMRKLKKFKFNIRSIIRFFNPLHLPSNEDIQKTFKNCRSDQVVSSIDYFPTANEFHYHIYSYPYTLIYYDNITNNFRGGLFESVHKISLFDERPFEYEFFLKIVKSFPFIEELHLHNRESQKNDNQQWSVIEYPHLNRLDLVKAHENYLEQFLNNTKTCLLNNIGLRVNYNSLQRVTDNFTSDVTRMNCSKIDCLILYDEPEFYSPYLKDYFSHAKIC